MRSRIVAALTVAGLALGAGLVANAPAQAAPVQAGPVGSAQTPKPDTRYVARSTVVYTTRQAIALRTTRTHGQAVTVDGKAVRNLLPVTFSGVSGWMVASTLTARRPADAWAFKSPSTIKRQYRNGYVPASIMAVVAWDRTSYAGTPMRVSKKAYEDLVLLNHYYKKRFKENLPLDEGYRTYARQVKVKKEQGKWAAKPGTSNHGWGVALDLPDYRYGGKGKQWTYSSVRYQWMKANGPTFGWYAGRVAGEPWHIEYLR